MNRVTSRTIRAVLGLSAVLVIGGTGGIAISTPVAATRSASDATVSPRPTARIRPSASAAQLALANRRSASEAPLAVASTPPTPATVATRPSASAAPSTPAHRSSASAAPRHTGNVIVGGDRPVTVHVPPGYDPAKPAPLLLVLHGYGSSGREEDAYLHLGKEAARRGYLYADPDGTRDSHGREFWNATDACCDLDRSNVDDAAYLSTVIREIQASFAVDPNRIDLIGHSNGAFMSYAMACTHADQIAAIASLAGATYMHPADCAPTAPVAVLEIHGTADRTVAYGGGTLDVGSARRKVAYPGADASVADWARYDGC